MTEKRIIRLMWLLGIVLIGLLFSMAVSGCGSKKKVVAIEREKVETSSEKKIEVTSQNDIKTTQETVKKIEIENETENETFSGEVADSSKDATVTVERRDGKIVRTYRNFKTVAQGETKTKETVKDTFGQNLSKTDLSKIDLTQKEQIAEKREKKSIEKDLEVKRGFPWWWLILIAFSIAIYLWIGKLKKTYLPWKWLS